MQTNGSERQATTTALVLLMVVLSACGDVDTPGCDDGQYRDAHYRACVGEDKYAEHREEVDEDVRRLRKSHADPETMRDTLDCDVMPVHVCSTEPAPYCEWASHSPEPGAKLEPRCVCLLPHKVDGAKEQC